HRQQRVVELRRAIVAKTHHPALAFGMEAVAQERDQNLHPREVLHPASMRDAIVRQRYRSQHGMQRRRLELVSQWPVDRLRLEKMVGVDGLRRSGEAVDAVR